MTNNVPAPASRTNIQAGGAVAAIVPQTLDDCFRLAQALAISGMAPRGIDKAEQIMVAIMAGAELGLAPFQSLQSFAVVNGRPTLWGDGLLAVVRARGVRVREWIDGEGDSMVANCVATRPDTGEEIARAFTVDDAKRAGLWSKTGPWQQYPKRMLQMRARALALRDGCADMLRGIQVREEVEDYQPIRDVTPEKAGVMSRLPGAATGAGFNQNVVEEGLGTVQPRPPEEIDAVVHDAQTGEVIDGEIIHDPSPEPQPEPADDRGSGDPSTSEADEGAQGDPTAGMKTGAELLAEQQATSADDAEILDWAASFLRGIEQLATVPEVASAWDAAKANGFVKRLKARNPHMAQQLAEAADARVAAINGEA